MKKMGIVMQKVINARILLLLILFFYLNNGYSQKAIEGIYILGGMTPPVQTDGGGAEVYAFSDDFTFEYKVSGELGTECYGKGHYLLTKDSLILKYDLTELKYQGYFRCKPYRSYKDSINLNFKIYDKDRKPIPDIVVSILDRDKIENTDSNGEVHFKLKKENESMSVTTVGPNFETLSFEIMNNLNYEIEIHFEGFGGHSGIPIKDEVEGYKIIKRDKDYFIVERGDGIKQTFRKWENDKQ